jgi:hypothetical protein
LIFQSLNNDCLKENKLSQPLCQTYSRPLKSP